MGEMSDYHGAPTPPRPPEVKRFFLAHRKATAGAELDAMKASLHTILSGYAATLKGFGEFTITLGRDDFEAHFPRCNGWEAWAADVAAGIHPVTREPRYTHFVTPGDRVGAATAKMLVHALSAGKPLLVMEFGKLRRAHSVIKVSSSPQDGWQVR